MASGLGDAHVRKRVQVQVLSLISRTILPSSPALTLFRHFFEHGVFRTGVIRREAQQRWVRGRGPAPGTYEQRYCDAVRSARPHDVVLDANPGFASAEPGVSAQLSVTVGAAHCRLCAFLR